MDPQVIAFAGLALVLTLTPGVDMALVTKNALAYGRRAAFLSILGISLGVAFYATASALGLSAVLSQSPTVYWFVKTLGAGYLGYIGIQSLRGSGAHATLPEGPGAVVRAGNDPGVGVSFRQGLLTNLLNPKIALFYLTLLPQFISPGDPVLAKSLLLASIHIGFGLVWMSAYAYFIVRLSDLFLRPSTRLLMERATGALLIALALRLAAEGLLPL
ncbi:MAG: LysE family translocator [Chloroflexota bacterium]